MGKHTRRGAFAAVSAAAALALAVPAALAADGTSYQDDPDRISSQWNDDNNLDHLFRIAGASRISTAIALMNASEKWQNGASTVIIARSDNFADALAAAPLADVLDAPVLLSAPGSSIDARVLAALDAKNTRTVVFIGGTGVFTEAARTQVLALADVTAVQRQRGVNRYETAAGIAKRVANSAYFTGTTKRTVNVYLATGLDFPDALAAGAAAADNDGVVLLTAGATMESFTYDFLVNERERLNNAANGIEIHTVGGAAEAAAEDAGIEDIADTNSGANRYATAVMLASKYKHTIEKIAITSGENYPDGVVAGAWVANHDGALLLTKNASLSPETANFLVSKGYVEGDTDVVVVGGTGSVSRNVSKQLADAMTF